VTSHVAHINVHQRNNESIQILRPLYTNFICHIKVFVTSDPNGNPEYCGFIYFRWCQCEMFVNICIRDLMHTNVFSCYLCLPLSAKFRGLTNKSHENTNKNEFIVYKYNKFSALRDTIFPKMIPLDIRSKLPIETKHKTTQIQRKRNAKDV